MILFLFFMHYLFRIAADSIYFIVNLIRPILSGKQVFFTLINLINPFLLESESFFIIFFIDNADEILFSYRITTVFFLLVPGVTFSSTPDSLRLGALMVGIN